MQQMCMSGRIDPDVPEHEGLLMSVNVILDILNKDELTHINVSRILQKTGK